MRSPLIAVALVVALVPAAAARACPPGELPALAVPKGVYHGAFANFSAGERNEDYVKAGRIRRFAELAGRPLAWATFSQHFFRGLAFPEAAARTVWRAGAVPAIRLMPWSRQVEHRAERTFTLERIAAGDFDSQLKAWGEAAAASRIPLVVEFGPEINGDWFPWNGRYHGAGAPSPEGPAGPAVFRAAFRRVVTDIRSGGARNVEFAFHVEDYSQPEAPWNQASLYYPGDSYVDWVGLSIYGDEPLQPFADSLRDAYAELTEFAPSKPVAIFEFAAPESVGARAKARWTRAALATLASGRFERVHVASWWDERYSEAGRTFDYRIDSSSRALRAYRAGIGSPRFITRPRLLCR